VFVLHDTIRNSCPLSKSRMVWKNKSEKNTRFLHGVKQLYSMCIKEARIDILCNVILLVNLFRVIQCTSMHPRLNLLLGTLKVCGCVCLCACAHVPIFPFVCVCNAKRAARLQSKNKNSDYEYLFDRFGARKRMSVINLPRADKDESRILMLLNEETRERKDFALLFLSH